jgi:hypothetical protein
MKTKNDWCTSNITERLLRRNADFRVDLKPYKFEKVGFTEASEIVAQDIAENYSNLFISFSGGLDSEYLVRLFRRLNIPFTPIIVSYCNETENAFAFATCKELGLDPVVINLSQEEFLHEFAKNICILMNGVGYNSTQLYAACKYVESKSGTLIKGDHMLGADGDVLIQNSKYANLNEWDFYTDVYTPITVIDLFLYTPQICYSMMPTEEGDIWNQHKHKLYGIPYRPKYKPKYPQNVMDILMKVSEFNPPCNRQIWWTKEEFDNIMDSYILNKP